VIQVVESQPSKLEDLIKKKKNTCQHTTWFKNNITNIINISCF
jgi:hypothetical protein